MGPEYLIGLPPRRGRLVIQHRDPKSQEPAIEGLISILPQDLSSLWVELFLYSFLYLFKFYRLN